MPRVKICGLRRADHALVAAEAGADFLGFVFVEGVRRQLTPEQGRDEVAAYRAGRERGGPALVGSFRDQQLEWVNEVVLNVGLDFAQLCGNETADYAARLVVPGIRQVRVRADTGSEELQEHVHQALDGHEMVVLDRYDPGVPGGSGRPFDWQVAEGVAGIRGVLLAGGLNPENVGDAKQMLNPWGVDVSSGVETRGVKDPERIRAFVAAARA